MKPNNNTEEITALAARYVNTTDRNIFLTGRAGTGKTTFLRDIASSTFKKCLIAAPTGIAAINAGGVTLHSLLQLPFGGFIPEEGYSSFLSESEKFNTPKTLLSGIKINSRKRKMIRELDLLIIDEVSMLRADTLDAIDHVLRSVRRKKEIPFGGLQILFIGDLLQLPPVARDEEWNVLSKYYNSTFFFEARVLRQVPPVFIELEKIYRQNDPEFIQVLNHLRNNQLTYEDTLLLNRRFEEYYELDNTIFLTTHNYKADRINEAKLAEIEDEVHTYKAVVEDDFPENLHPAPAELHLKLGAQVMFIKNDPTGEQRFFNGKLGEVREMSEDDMIIVSDGESIELSRYTWENIKYRLNSTTDEIEENTVGVFKQFPVRLAWAITIHKSQGLTFENAVIDIGEAFAPGQIYVALSRLTSLDGLILTAPIPDEILGSDPAIQDFSKQKQGLDKLQDNLGNHQKSFLSNLASQAYDFNSLHFELHEHLKSFTKDEKRSTKQQYLKWTQNLIAETIELEEIARKFRKQMSGYDITSGDYQQFMMDRLRKARDYFTPLLQGQLDKINQHHKELKVKKNVTKYRKEVEEIRMAFQKQQYRIDRVAVVAENMVKGVSSSKKDMDKIKVVPLSTKEEKSPTAQISYELYLQGLDIEAVAEKRGMAPSTIETHLSKYVAEGKIEVEKLLDPKKMENIQKVIEHLGSTQIGPIKSKLGDEYTYGDIKYTIAHLKSVNSTLVT